MNHSQAMGNVHPPLERTRRPLDYPGRRIMRTISAMRAEEARLARQAGERAEHPTSLGIVFLLLMLGALVLGLAVLDPTPSADAQHTAGVVVGEGK